METPTHHHLQIIETAWEAYIPKELEHCDTQEYKDVCENVYKWQTGLIDFTDFCLHAIMRILLIKKGGRTLNNLEIQFMHSNMFEVGGLMMSFFD